eukprot:g5578.t1
MEKQEASRRIEASTRGGGGGSVAGPSPAAAADAKAARVDQWLREQQRERGAVIKQRQLAFKAKRNKIAAAERSREQAAHGQRMAMAAQERAVGSRLKTMTAEQKRLHDEWERGQQARRARVRRRQRDQSRRQEERGRQLEQQLREREEKRHAALAEVQVRREQVTLVRRQAARQCQLNRELQDAAQRDAALTRLQRVDRRLLQMHQDKDLHERDVSLQRGEELRFRSEVAGLAYQLSTSPSAAGSVARKVERLRENYVSRAAASAAANSGGAAAAAGTGTAATGGPGARVSPRRPASSRRRAGRGTPRTGRAARPSSAPVAVEHDDLRPRLEGIRRCGLCRVEFLVSNLAGQVTKQAIKKMRRSWGCDQTKLKEVWGVVEPPLCAGAPYDGIRVCLFCSQFFDDILHGRSAGGVQPSPAAAGADAKQHVSGRMTERARKVQEYSQTDKLLVDAGHHGEGGSRSESFLRRAREREKRQHDSVTRDIQASIRYQR